MKIDICFVIITYALSIPAFTYLYLKQKNSADNITVCRLILVAGIILRILYICYTDINTRQHDVENFFGSSGGHSGYIHYLLDNKHLPDFDPRNVWQFYHPPLHHAICAFFLFLIEKPGVMLSQNSFELLQILPMIYSSLFCISAYKTLKLCGINGRSLCFSTAFVTFHPTLIILSGSINNDMLSALFCMCALHFTVKWCSYKKWLDIGFIAICIGFGMCTKLTVGLLAPAIGCVFLYVFIRDIKEYRKTIPQFIVFGLICVPVGLFFPIRNHLKFGVPLNYVPKLPLDSSQHIDNTIVKRIFDFMPFQFSSPFVQWHADGAPYNEFNPIIALWKTSAFDENTFFTNCISFQAVCVILLATVIILSIYSAVTLIINIRKKGTLKTEFKILITVLSVTLLANYMVFCISYPHVCTQNMRYCVPLIFTQSALIGLYGNNSAVRKVTALFCGCSIFMFFALQFYAP